MTGGIAEGSIHRTSVSEEAMMTDQPVHYRTVEPRDVDSVLQLWSQPGGVAGSTDTVEALQLRLERDQDLFALAFSGDQLIGTLIGGWDNWRGNLYRLAVSPEFRRQGIARHLLEMVQARLADRGAARVYALAYEPEHAPVAMDFWRSTGFSPNESVVPYVKNL